MQNNFFPMKKNKKDLCLWRNISRKKLILPTNYSSVQEKKGLSFPNDIFVGKSIVLASPNEIFVDKSFYSKKGN